MRTELTSLKACTANKRPADAIDMLNIWGHAPQMKWAASPTPGSSVMRAYKPLLEKSRPGVLAGDLAACHQFAFRPEQFAAIRATTLVLSGARDIVTLAACGHVMMQEAPGKVLDALRDFFKP